MRSGSEWQASVEREGGRWRECRRGAGRGAGGDRESRQMADIRLPGDLSGQVPDRLASARDRVHGAASGLQLHLAARRANLRSLRGECQRGIGGLHRVGVRQEHVHGDDNIAGNRREFLPLDLTFFPL